MGLRTSPNIGGGAALARARHHFEPASSTDLAIGRSTEASGLEHRHGLGDWPVMLTRNPVGRDKSALVQAARMSVI